MPPPMSMACRLLFLGVSTRDGPEFALSSAEIHYGFRSNSLRRWCMNRPCGVGSRLLSDPHPMPIEKKFGGPSAAIRFKMLQAIRASLRCDSG